MAAKKQAALPENTENDPAKISARARELDGPGATGWFKAFDSRRRPITLMVPGQRPQQLNELRLRSVKDGAIVPLIDGLNMKSGQPEFRREQLMACLARRDKNFDVPIYVVDEPVDRIQGVRFGGDVPVRDANWDAARLYYAKERARSDARISGHVSAEKARIKNQLAMDPEGLAPSLPSADVAA